MLVLLALLLLFDPVRGASSSSDGTPATTPLPPRAHDAEAGPSTWVPSRVPAIAAVPTSPHQAAADGPDAPMKLTNRNKKMTQAQRDFLTTFRAHPASKFWPPSQKMGADFRSQVLDHTMKMALDHTNGEWQSNKLLHLFRGLKLDLRLRTSEENMSALRLRVRAGEHASANHGVALVRKDPDGADARLLESTQVKQDVRRRLEAAGGQASVARQAMRAELGKTTAPPSNLDVNVYNHLRDMTYGNRRGGLVKGEGQAGGRRAGRQRRSSSQFPPMTLQMTPREAALVEEHGGSFVSARNKARTRMKRASAEEREEWRSLHSRLKVKAAVVQMARRVTGEERPGTSNREVRYTRDLQKYYAEANNNMEAMNLRARAKVRESFPKNTEAHRYLSRLRQRAGMAVLGQQLQQQYPLAGIRLKSTASKSRPKPDAVATPPNRGKGKQVVEDVTPAGRHVDVAGSSSGGGYGTRPWLVSTTSPPREAPESIAPPPAKRPRPFDLNLPPPMEHEAEHDAVRGSSPGSS